MHIPHEFFLVPSTTKVFCLCVSFCYLSVPNTVSEQCIDRVDVGSICEHNFMVIQSHMYNSSYQIIP
jgi:hypothetical protein